MRTDGRMGMRKVIVAFRNFLNAPKNSESTRLTLFAPVFINTYIYLFIYLSILYIGYVLCI
jgi:hypothetical protein